MGGGSSQERADAKPPIRSEKTGTDCCVPYCWATWPSTLVEYHFGGYCVVVDRLFAPTALIVIFADPAPALCSDTL